MQYRCYASKSHPDLPGSLVTPATIFYNEGASVQAGRQAIRQARGTELRWWWWWPRGSRKWRKDKEVTDTNTETQERQTTSWDRMGGGGPNTLKGKCGKEGRKEGEEGRERNQSSFSSVRQTTSAPTINLKCLTIGASSIPLPRPPTSILQCSAPITVLKVS